MCPRKLFRCLKTHKAVLSAPCAAMVVKFPAIMKKFRKLHHRRPHWKHHLGRHKGKHHWKHHTGKHHWRHKGKHHHKGKLKMAWKKAKGFFGKMWHKVTGVFRKHHKGKYKGKFKGKFKGKMKHFMRKKPSVQWTQYCHKQTTSKACAATHKCKYCPKKKICHPSWLAVKAYKAKHRGQKKSYKLKKGQFKAWMQFCRKHMDAGSCKATNKCHFCTKHKICKPSWKAVKAAKKAMAKPVLLGDAPAAIPKGCKYVTKGSVAPTCGKFIVGDKVYKVKKGMVAPS